MLDSLISQLRQAPGILHKRDIQTAAGKLGRWIPQGTDQAGILVGDDCAAIADGEGYLLLAAEGIWPVLVETEPWFAGWCAVLVNVSDIAAMGGRAIAVVDALWSQSSDQAAPLWDGMLAASRALKVPIVGGHTNCHSPYNALSVAILGRSRQLLTSFTAQPGDTLLLVIDLDGQQHSRYPFWDAATRKSPEQLQQNFALLPQLAESGLCDTAKDISMGGIVGTTLMLLETSGCGAVLDLDSLPCPAHLPLATWLVSFPSYGFLLSVRSPKVASVQALFQAENLTCAAIGTITSDCTLTLGSGSESAILWDFSQEPLTGFAPS